MAIKFLANTVGRDAAQVRLIEPTFESREIDSPNHRNVLGGARHLSWTQEGNDPLGVAYVNVPVNRLDHPENLSGSSWTATGASTADLNSNMFGAGNDFNDTSVWAQNSIGDVQPVVISDLSGFSRGFLVTEAVATARHHINIPSLSFTAGISYYADMIVKANGRRHLQFLFAGGGAFATNTEAIFDLVDGSIDYQDPNIDNMRITHLGEGWYRCSVDFIADTTGSGSLLIQMLNDSLAESYLGTGAGIYIAQARLFAHAGLPVAGDVPASKIAETAVTSGHFVRAGTFLVLGEASRASVIFKSDERSQALLQLYDGISKIHEYRFNIGGATISSSGVTSVGYVDLGNDYYLHYLEFSPGSSADYTLYVQSMSGGASSYAGTLYSGLFVENPRVSPVTTKLEADHLVIVEADVHEGHAVEVGYMSRDEFHGANSNTLYSSSNFSQDLSGPTDKDYVLSFDAVDSVDAFYVLFDDGSGGAYQKTLRQIFFSKAVSFSDFVPGSGVSYARASLDDPPVNHHDKYYHLRGVMQLSFDNVSQSLLDSFLSLPLDEPMFIFDDSGDSTFGYAIDRKSLHGIVLDQSITQLGDDLYRLSVSFGVLMYWQ